MFKALLLTFCGNDKFYVYRRRTTCLVHVLLAGTHPHGVMHTVSMCIYRDTITVFSFGTCHSPRSASGNTISGVIRTARRLCPWAEIRDYSSRPCENYRERAHNADWICDHCHAGCLSVAYLYSHRCLDDLLIKYSSPPLNTCAAAEIEFVLWQEWRFAQRKVMFRY